jgi:hypothetical protein
MTDGTSAVTVARVPSLTAMGRVVHTKAHLPQSLVLVTISVQLYTPRCQLRECETNSRRQRARPSVSQIQISLDNAGSTIRCVLFTTQVIGYIANDF